MTIEPTVTHDDLQAFADGMLPAERHAEVASYLLDHPDAALVVDRIVSQTAALRAAAATLLERDIPDHLRVARLFERRRVGSGHWFEDLGSMLRPQIAAALVAGLLVGGFGGWSLHVPAPHFSDGVRPLVAEAADAYAVYEPDRLHPVEVSANNKDDLMRWATSRLRRPVAAPDAIDDFKLLGGRVVATSRGPAAMFMYENTGRRIVLMICPLSLHGTAPITASAQGDLTGVSWSDRGVGYSLVGALPRDTLETLGSAVRRQTGEKA